MQAIYPLRSLFADLIISTGMPLSVVDKSGMVDFVNRLLLISENDPKQVRTLPVRFVRIAQHAF
jgi:hypothetical protein